MDRRQRQMCIRDRLSTRNDSPETASRPFSASRDGFIMGEGGGCLVLEELEHAKARGAKIYAEVAGVGMSADAHHLTASHPEGLGAKLVMLNALEDAEMKPEEVDYINVHGTSTPVGDISEAKAIKEVFGQHAYELNISSTKSMTGHLLGAAGAVESIASILAIKNGICLLYTSDAADDLLCVDIGGSRIIKKKNKPLTISRLYTAVTSDESSRVDREDRQISKH